MPYKDKQVGKEHHRLYYLANKKEFQEWGKAYYIANSDVIIARSKNYYEKNSKKCQEKNKKYYEKNKEWVFERQKIWNKKNPEKVRDIKLRYKHRHNKEIKEYNKEYVRLNRVSRNKYRNRWRKDNPEKAKDEKLKFRFGITIENYKKLISNQYNKCGVCGDKFTEKSSHYPCVDHDHITKNIRGILCRKCNSGIGGFKDDPKILRNAIEWLKKKEYKKKFCEISSLDKEKLCIKQENRCGICKKNFSKNYPANIDHNHKNQKIRGILCGKCNRSLGLLRDNLNLIKNAIKWLNKGKL